MYNIWENILGGIAILLALCLILGFVVFVVGSLILQTTKALIVIIIATSVLTLSYFLGKFFNKWY